MAGDYRGHYGAIGRTHSLRMTRLNSVVWSAGPVNGELVDC
jgi:hypothetical protein